MLRRESSSLSFSTFDINFYIKVGEKKITYTFLFSDGAASGSYGYTPDTLYLVQSEGSTVERAARKIWREFLNNSDMYDSFEEWADDEEFEMDEDFLSFIYQEAEDTGIWFEGYFEGEFTPKKRKKLHRVQDYCDELE